MTYIHTNLQGSPVEATDNTGKLLWSRKFKPYGTVNGNIAPLSQNYTGHTFDRDLGLVYAGARYYDPRVGRFTGFDPKGFTEENFVSFNRYAYANNNPYKYVDPDGQAPIADYFFPAEKAPPGKQYEKQLELLSFAAKLATLEVDSQYANTFIYPFVRGTFIHTAFARYVNALSAKTGLPFHTEVSYMNRKEELYGTRGTIRVDVIYGDREAPLFGVDLKTGLGYITKAQQDGYDNHFPLFAPVYQLNVEQTGSYFDFIDNLYE